MNIGEAAKRSGLPPKTIRYYESIKLVEPAMRNDNGYRDYNETDIEQLRFLQRARTTGFNIDECRQLLSLYKDQSRHSHHVKELVMEKAERVLQQIHELQMMHECLLELSSLCQADEEPHCAILDELSELNSPREQEDE